MILDLLHNAACLVIVLGGVLHMNNMTRATPILDIVGWWCITVGAFAHGVLRPRSGVEWADAMLVCGGALVIILESWPHARKICLANRRKRERDGETA